MLFFTRIASFLSHKKICFAGTERKRTIRALRPGERECVLHAPPARQEEFATGRWCARKLLKKMGRENHTLLKGDEGDVSWPPGVCGSVSHTRGAWCALAALTRDYRSLGIDIEAMDRKISPGAQSFILNPDEEVWLSALPERRDFFVKLLFCAKESIFKLLFPLVRKKFYFRAVSLCLPGPSVFSAFLRKDLGPGTGKGLLLNGYFFKSRKWLVAVSFLKGEIP